MSDELKLAQCPFCGGEARIESNRDWHKLFAAHDDDCVFEADDHMLMYPAQPGYLIQIAEDWNRRATPSPSTASIAEDECSEVSLQESIDTPEFLDLVCSWRDGIQDGALWLDIIGAINDYALKEARAALASKPTTREAARQSIEDDDEFQDLVGDVCRAGSYNESIEKPLRALIAHIDTWGGAAPAAGDTEREE